MCGTHCDTLQLPWWDGFYVCWVLWVLFWGAGCMVEGVDMGEGRWAGLGCMIWNSQRISKKFFKKYGESSQKKGTWRINIGRNPATICCHPETSYSCRGFRKAPLAQSSLTSPYTSKWYFVICEYLRVPEDHSVIAPNLNQYGHQEDT